jgi:hypothetical protein
MPTSMLFNSWEQYACNQLYFSDGSVPNPDKTKFYGILCNGNIDDISSKGAVFASEIEKTPTNGYTRFNPVFSQAAFYDSSNKRFQMPVVTWTVSLPEAIQYNATVLIADGRSESNASVTVTTGTPGIFTLVSHGLGTNEEVVITADSGGSMPGGVTSGQIYYVEYIDGDNFSIKTTTSSAAVDIASAGSDVRVGYAKGKLVAIRNEDSVLTLAASAPRSWNFFLGTASYFGIGQGN